MTSNFTIPNNIFLAQTEKELFSAIDETLKQYQQTRRVLDWNFLLSYIQNYYPASTLHFVACYSKHIKPDEAMENYIDQAGGLGDLARGLSVILKDGSILDNDGKKAQKILDMFANETKVNKDSSDYYLRNRYVKLIGYLAEIYVKFNHPDTEKWFKTISSFVNRHSIKRNTSIDLGGNLHIWKKLPGMENHANKLDKLIDAARSGSDLFMNHYEKNGNKKLAEYWLDIFSKLSGNSAQFDRPNLKIFLQSTSRLMILFSPKEKTMITESIIAALVKNNELSKLIKQSIEKKELSCLWQSLFATVFEQHPEIEEKLIFSINIFNAAYLMREHPDWITPKIWNYLINESLSVGDTRKIIGMAIRGECKQLRSLDLFSSLDCSFSNMLDVLLSGYNDVLFAQKQLGIILTELDMKKNLSSLPRLKSLMAALAFEHGTTKEFENVLQLKSSQEKNKINKSKYDMLRTLYGKPTVDYVLLSESMGVFDAKTSNERIRQVWSCIEKGCAFELSMQTPEFPIANIGLLA
jgi:hypothetical protein